MLKHSHEGDTVPLVSVVIVNYNSGDLLKDCVRSLLRYVAIDFEIIVVDNVSTDGSERRLPSDAKIKLVRSPQNGGFAKGSNLGASVARGQILHFLNPDAEVTKDINVAYQTALSCPDIVYATHITDTHRNCESRGHALPTLSNVFNLMFRRSRIQKWYIGASVIVSKSVFRRIDGWSEDYFMYAEDMDFFYKAYLAGISSQLLSARVRHHQGGSTRQIWSASERLERVEKSALIFARKYGLQFDYFVFKHLALIKCVFSSPSRALKEGKAYWKAIFKKKELKRFSSGFTAFRDTNTIDATFR